MYSAPIQQTHKNSNKQAMREGLDHQTQQQEYDMSLNRHFHTWSDLLAAPVNSTGGATPTASTTHNSGQYRIDTHDSTVSTSAPRSTNGPSGPQRQPQDTTIGYDVSKEEQHGSTKPPLRPTTKLSRKCYIQTEYRALHTPVQQEHQPWGECQHYEDLVAEENRRVNHKHRQHRGDGRPQEQVQPQEAVARASHLFSRTTGVSVYARVTNAQHCQRITHTFAVSIHALGVNTKMRKGGSSAAFIQ